ncbi:hypothetical protein ACIBI9_19315 [Nonomuraea sp. NPDC050451]|uniref:hypothetical protein n=1 Tax=Nonomuraea sp. NPDC050451 TaxID=3364364 RepID=UPI003794EB96
MDDLYTAIAETLARREQLIPSILRTLSAALLLAAVLVGLPMHTPIARAVAPVDPICRLNFSITTGNDGLGEGSAVSILFGGQRVIFREGGGTIHRGGTGDHPHTTFLWETRLEEPCVTSEELLDGFTIEHSGGGDDWDLARIVVTDPTREEPGVRLPVPQPHEPFQLLFLSGTPLHHFESDDTFGTVERWTARQDLALDTDGDGLTDLDELRGFVTGAGPSLRVDQWLAQNNADPCRLTIAVEIDWFVDDATGVSDEPSDLALQEARTMFDRAPLPLRPIRCPYYRQDRPGVQLLTHKSDAIRLPTADRTQALSATWAGNRTYFDYYRDGAVPGFGHFTPGRGGRFFYSLWGYAWMNANDGVSGWCCADPNDNSFAITLGSWTNRTDHMAAAVFVHELGHALDLSHGGSGEEPNYKPNYLSVMNYRYGAIGLPRFQDWANLLMRMPADTDYQPDSPAMRAVLDQVSDLDYSRERLPLLAREAGGRWHLDEAAGIGTSRGAAVFWYDPSGTLRVGDSTQGLDWNMNGNPQESDVDVNIMGGREICVTDNGDNALSPMTRRAGDDQVVGTTIIAGQDGLCDTSLIDATDDKMIPDSWDAGTTTRVASPGFDYPARFGYAGGVAGFSDWEAVRFRIGVSPDAGRPLRSADSMGISQSQFDRNVTEMIRAFITSRFPQGLPAQGTVIDAGALQAPAFAVSGVSGWLDARKRHTLRLAPGRHTLSSPGATPIAFTVDDTGVVDYAPDLTGVSGRGTHTLTVTGLPIRLDGTGLSYPHIGLSGLGWLSSSQVQDVRLLPGDYTLVVGGVGGWPFRVTAEGKITYGEPYARILSGAGTGTLTIAGIPVTLDATDLSCPYIGLAGHGWRSTRQVQNLRLLPGTHAYVASGAPGTQGFRVTGAGLIDYDDQADPILSGRGTATLRAAP